MKAARVDANQANIVEAFRKAGAVVYCTHRIGGGYPDLMIEYHGKTALVEVKTATGRLTPAERAFFDDWRGGILRVIRTEEEALALIAEMAEPLDKTADPGV